MPCYHAGDALVWMTPDEWESMQEAENFRQAHVLVTGMSPINPS